MKISCPLLSQFSHLSHGFFPQTKKPGNDAEIGAAFSRLVTLRQVHGTRVCIVTHPGDELPEGDGLVTTVPGIALGIWTADCGPVLFYDPKAGLIGACHAGWKGAKEGIIQETIQTMTDLGARREMIYASLGPTIQQHDYEVGPEFPDLMGCSYDPYFYPSETRGHHFFNLPLYITNLLKEEGLSFVQDVRANTFPGPFSSRRRALRQGKEPVSDNLSVIAMS